MAYNMKYTPPHSIESERYALACMFNQDVAFLSGSSVLDVTDFYIEAHKHIFEALRHLEKNHKDACTVGVFEYVKSIKAEQSTPLSYIIEVADLCTGSVSFEECVSKLKEKRIARGICEKSEEHLKLASAGEDLESLFEKVRIDFSDLEKDGIGSSWFSLEELLDKSIKSIQERIQIRESGFSCVGLPTGFAHFDSIVGGLSPSHMIVCAARPGMGKTALALNIMENLVIKYKKPVGFFSLEMSNGEIIDRLLSSHSHIPLNKIRTGCLDDFEYRVLKDKVAQIRNSPFIIDDSPYQTMATIASKAIRMKNQYHIEVLFIDYLQLINGTNKKSNDSKYLEVTEISRKIKCLAKHLNIPIFVLSQLSRSVEQRSDKTPQLSDLRDSGAIEQDADSVIFIYRGDYYDPASSQSKIIVAKNRHGSMGSVDVAFKNHICRFEEK